ncbi:MAG: 30S ribosomal protein S27ae [Candidatus Woesearchaeota archaeon]
MGKKKQKGKNHPVYVYKMYEDGKAKNRSCPKCGVGVFMSKHKDRMHCGKCGYAEFMSKS